MIRQTSSCSLCFMPRPRLIVLTLAATVAMLSARVGAQKNAADPGLDDLLAKAAAYVLRFETQFANVVSEEDYDQRVLLTGMTRPAGPTQRRLRSDFTLVQEPGGQEWIPFRDVFEVDGKPLRDRSDRLTKLFLNATAASLDNARQIMAESARYNIGGVNRTINVPVLVFEVLRPLNQPRFQFTRSKVDPAVGPTATIVAFRERARPSFIRGPNESDILTNGRIWIDADTGIVLKTNVVVDAVVARAEITTSFRRNDTFGVAVPVEMNEEYTGSRRPTVVGTARYSNFRKFGIDVKSDMK